MLLYKNLPNFKNNDDTNSQQDGNNNICDDTSDYDHLLVNRKYFEKNPFKLNDFDTNTRKKNVPYALLGKKRDK